MKKEWVKAYHTGVVGTTYHITVEGETITLRAKEKPYKITINMKDLETLL